MLVPLGNSPLSSHCQDKTMNHFQPREGQMSQMLLQTTVVSRYLREAAALWQWMNPLLSDLSGAEAALTAENFGPRGGFQANAKI